MFCTIYSFDVSRLYLKLSTLPLLYIYAYSMLFDIYSIVQYCPLGQGLLLYCPIEQRFKSEHMDLSESAQGRKST